MAKRSAGRCTTGINTSTCIMLATSRTSKVSAMAGRGQAVFRRAMPSACTRSPRSVCGRASRAAGGKVWINSENVAPAFENASARRRDYYMAESSQTVSEQQSQNMPGRRFFFALGSARRNSPAVGPSSSSSSSSSGPSRSAGRTSLPPGRCGPGAALGPGGLANELQRLVFPIGCGHGMSFEHAVMRNTRNMCFRILKFGLI